MLNLTVLKQTALQIKVVLHKFNNPYKWYTISNRAITVGIRQKSLYNIFVQPRGYFMFKENFYILPAECLHILYFVDRASR